MPSGRTATTVVAAPGAHTCVIYDNGSVSCWGNNNAGELGLSDTVTRGNTPATVPANLTPLTFGARIATRLAAGGGSDPNNVPSSVGQTCVILDNGSLRCWGNNINGELGLGDTTQRTAPVTVPLPSGRTARKIATGYGVTCLNLDDYSLRCWGDGSAGQLGQGNPNDLGQTPATAASTVPAISMGGLIVNFGTGSDTTCGVAVDGTTRCFGSNSNGELGLGDTIGRGTTPGTIPTNYTAISLGTGRTTLMTGISDNNTCGLDDIYQLHCWGDNTFGQLGYGDSVARGQTPDTVPSTYGTVPF